MEQPDKYNNIEKLLLRYYEGDVTEDERKQVKTWMQMSDENRREAEHIYALYLATDAIIIQKKINLEKVMTSIERRMEPRKKIACWQLMQRVAAILFLPFFIAWLAQTFYNNGQGDIQTMEVKTAPGMRASVTLPDGTFVCLNSASSLSYPSQFLGDSRKVELKGEAYFEVTKNPEKHFIVSTPHQSQIEVLGTRFNVEAYEKEKELCATLVEGSICFSFNQNDEVKKVSLTPGQKLKYNSESADVQIYTTSGEAELAWKEGKLVFENTPLNEVLRSLSKHYNVNLVLKSEHLAKIPFTGVFTNLPLERILEYFKISSQLQWKYQESSNREDEKYTIEIY